MRWLRLAILGLSALKTVAQTVPAESDYRAMLQTAQRQIAAFNADAPASTNQLQLVYFHPADREPLPQWRERLERVVTDVSEFYRDEMQKYGLKSTGLARARSDGRLVFHVVRGQKPASAYHHDSGDETAAEIQRALKDAVDREREFVLVFYGLCRREPDGRYVFDAPYYGSGNSRGGLAHAADCELLDPLQLTNRRQQIVYTEHYYPRKKQSVAQFNSMYLGGVAHELGHGLGLTHDAGSLAERAQPGTSLMGHGNLNYREDRWGGKYPSYLSAGTALRLLSNPLLTGSNRERWTPPQTRLSEFTLRTREGGVAVRGRVTGKIPVYGVIASLCRKNPGTGELRDDHDTITFPALTDASGGFYLDLRGLPNHAYRLRLSVLHVNGAAPDFDFYLPDDAADSVAALNAVWAVELAVAAILRHDPGARALVDSATTAAGSVSSARKRLEVMRELVDPPTPISLINTTSNSVYLSDASWTEAKVGWGKVARNHYWFDENIQNGLFLELGGTLYPKGLYAHASSRYAFDLGGNWKVFTARVGLRDGADQQGSAIFTVRGDGKELYRSAILRPGKQDSLKLDLTGIQQLELIAEGGEGHNQNCWAIWVDPVVSRNR